jgi:hypothetical protein
MTFPIGTVLRCGAGSTALMQVDGFTTLEDGTTQYLGTHHFDGPVRARSHTVQVASQEDLETWYKEEDRRNRRRLAMFDLLQFMQEKNDWSAATFGPGKRTGGVIAHIRSELTEIEANPDDVVEWCDVILLAMDGAFRAGFTPAQVITALINKQSKNTRRQWPDWRTKSQDEFSTHVKGIED